MRRTLSLIVLAALVAGGIGYWFAIPRRPSPIPLQNDRAGVQITRPRPQDNSVGLQPETVRINPAGDPIAQTLEKLFATTEGGGPSAFPQGTRLLSLKVDRGVATLDLGSEFRKVNVMGDTGESLAQNALRQALAQFPQVEKMTVLVEGRPFEGEHSGAWVDIPVRDDTTRASSRP